MKIPQRTVSNTTTTGAKIGINLFESSSPLSFSPFSGSIGKDVLDMVSVLCLVNRDVTFGMFEGAVASTGSEGELNLGVVFTVEI